jgi:hypothetical protein
MLTLAQVKSSSVANVAGVNVSDPQFVQYVNDAVRQLMELGNNGGSRGWWGTVQHMVGTAYDNCIVWPANVVAVLGMEQRGHEIPVRNHWYSFLPLDQHCHRWAQEWPTQHRHHHGMAVFEGETCLFRPIQAATYVTVLGLGADVGKTITLYGTDYAGNEVFQTRADGSVQRGVVLTLGGTVTPQPAIGGATTPMQMFTVTSVAKDATIGAVQLFQWNGTTGIGSLMASYNAGDINPKFLYSRLHRSHVPACNVHALVKLGFSAVSQDSDVLPLDCVDAIKSMVQSIRSRESGDEENGDKFERTAIRRLVAQVNNRFPIEQMVVRFNPLGDSYGRRTLTSIT